MTREDFLSALAAELQRRRVPFVLGDLIAFTEAAGPIEEEPVDVGRWAEEFLRSQVCGAVEGATRPLPADMTTIDSGE